MITLNLLISLHKKVYNIYISFFCNVDCVPKTNALFLSSLSVLKSSMSIYNKDSFKVLSCCLTNLSMTVRVADKRIGVQLTFIKHLTVFFMSDLGGESVGLVLPDSLGGVSDTRIGFVLGALVDHILAMDIV